MTVLGSDVHLAEGRLELLRRRALALHPRPVLAGSMPLLPWVIRHRTYLRPGQLFDLDHHRYLVGLYNCGAQEMVVYKAAQMGASELGISAALHACDQRQMTVMIVFPNSSAVSDFSAARIGAALEASPYLAQIVSGSAAIGPNGRRLRGADRVTLKRVRDSFLYLRGGHVASGAMGLKAVAADKIILDELDEMDARAPELATKRLGHSEIAERMDLSTPTYFGVGIHARWLLSDQREWFVRCNACGERQPLTLAHFIDEWDELARPVHWHGKEEGRYYLACQRCGRELNRLGAGEWVAAYPGRSIAGFHLVKFFSHTADLGMIVGLLSTSDETVRRECFNQDLGLPYTPRGGQLTDQDLDLLRRDYLHGPVAGERPFIGVDVGNVIHVVIRGPANEKGERPQRFAGEVTTFSELGTLIRRFHPRRVVIDALPETRMARQLQADFPSGQVWLAYYSGDSKEERPVRFDATNGTVLLDRTRSLDATLAGFSGADQENTLPANARDIGAGDYYQQITGMIRVVDPRAIQAAARYVATGADHYAHAENYCWAASQVAATPRLGVAIGRGARGWTP